MEEKTVCPRCGSDRIQVVSICRKLGTGIGGVIGGVLGYIGKRKIPRKIVSIGAKLIPLIPEMNRNGKLIAALTGFLAFASFGNCIGSVFDEHVISKYKCDNCGTKFYR